MNTRSDTKSSPSAPLKKLKGHAVEQEFEDIAQYYDELDRDLSHFVNSNDICTPLRCVKEMVDTIPKDFWDKGNIKVLDPCCGNGNFHAYISTKTTLKNLYFNDINETRLENVRLIFGAGAKISNKDFLSFDHSVKYDLVVSNPPYAKFGDDNKRVSKNHNLSRAFIRKAIDVVKDEGYILFIVPNNWMSYADRNELPSLLSRYQFLHINIHGAKRWFPHVGSSFTWFLLQKTPNRKRFTIENNYIIRDKVEASLHEDVKFIPLYYSDIVQSILKKTIYADVEKYPVETSCDLHRYTKSNELSARKEGKFKYKIIHTPTQELYASRPHKYQKGHKVFLSLSNQYRMFVDACGMTQSIAFIRCDSKQSALRTLQSLQAPIFVFLNNIARYGNFNNIRILQSLPLLKHIKLTDKEHSFIKTFNKRYYGKKEK